MKTWKAPELMEVAFDETNYGGTPSMDFDNKWFDQNGALHVNFTPHNEPDPDENATS